MKFTFFREMNWQGSLTFIFYLILFTIFPLYMHDKYFDLIDAKYRFYWTLGLAFIFLSIPAFFLDGGKSARESGKTHGKSPRSMRRCCWCSGLSV